MRCSPIYKKKISLLLESWLDVFNMGLNYYEIFPKNKTNNID